MDGEEEKAKAFKVEDRRRFSAEGELKPEHRGPEPEAAASSGGISPEGPPPGAAGSAGAADPKATAAARSRSTAAANAQSPASGPGGEITFASFMVGISTQALVHLGEIQDPQSDQPGVNLAAAQQLIDIVAMLKEKTRGNLDREEQALIDAILFELRMKYVERARPGS